MSLIRKLFRRKWTLKHHRKWNICHYRVYTTVTAPESQKVFNSDVKLIQKRNAALLSNSNDYDYIRLEISSRIIDRIINIDRDCLNALDYGSNSGQFYRQLCDYIVTNDNNIPCNIKHLYQFEPSIEMSKRDDNNELNNILGTTIYNGEYEDLSCFNNDYFDLIVTSMSLQWINNIPQALSEIFRILKPDGCFIGSFVGNGTLQELRSSLLLSDQERFGGYGNHMSPMIETKDVGNLLSRTKFNLITVDNENIIIPYPNMFTLIEHLHGSGDQHCSFNRDKYVSKDTFIAAAAIYDTMYSDSNQIDTDTRNELKNEIQTNQENITIDATFNIINFIAWKPHESQRKPLERGSQMHSLTEFEDIVDERNKIKQQKNTQNNNNDDNDPQNQ